MAVLKIASFDPASQRNIGWSLVRYDSEQKNLLTASADTFVMKSYAGLWQVYWPMFSTVDRFLKKEKPDLVVIEKTSSFSGGFITGQVSQCIGCILAACGKNKLEVEFVYPSSVKLLTAGYGKATKSQIRKCVQKFILDLIGEEVKYSSEHAYDAMANILFYLMSKKYLVPQEEFPWLTEKQEKNRKKRVDQCLKKLLMM